MSSTYLEYLKTKQMKEMFGVRHIQAFLLAGALLVNHVQESNIGISAVAITDKQYQTEENYHWKHDQVKMTIGSYFYSLMLSCILAGYLSTKLDIKVMLLTSNVLGTLATYLTPTLIRHYHWNIFLYIRLVQGAVKGFVRPLIYSQLVRWLPPDELMLIGPVVLSCIYLGNGIIIMMGGYLSTGQGGWPSIFYFSGNIGFIWCLAYIGLGSRSPNTCFYISVYERRYIEESLPSAIRSPYRESIPWKKILTCVPLYAIIIAQSANNYAFQSFIKIVPLFYQNSLLLDIKLVGLLLGLPFLSASILVYIQYQVVKFVIKKKKLDISEIRHIANGIGQFGAFYFFMYCAFSTSYSVSFALHYIGMLISSFQLNGFYMNYIDLSPNFVGLISGIGVSCSHFCSILGPYVSFTLYRYYQEDPSGPQSDFESKQAIMFYIALFYLCSGILWELLGSTKIQPFNDIKESDEFEDKMFNESEIIKT